MKVIVTGSAGQLGSDLVRVLAETKAEVVQLCRADLDITDWRAVKRVLDDHRPDAVINCAAYVRVDLAEDEPDIAFRVNGLGALYIARASARVGALCIQVSTDYIFDGEKGEAYCEADQPNPINFYGVSKLAGEQFVRQVCRNHLIVRVASLFGCAGASGKGGNFIESILAKARAGGPIGVVDDVRMSPTYTYDASRAMVELLRDGLRGVVHLSNAGSCTWYEFARKALTLASPGSCIEPTSAQTYPAKARRPSNSALESIVHSLQPDPLRPWPEALEAYLGEKGYIEFGRRARSLPRPL